METVACYIGENLLGSALARLCRLALEPSASGQPTLSTWEYGPLPDTRRLGPITDLLHAQEEPSLEDVASQPLLWLVALDEFLGTGTRFSRALPFRAVRDGDAEFWLIQRIYADFPRGYAHKQYGLLRRWLHYHHVIPIKASPGVPTQVYSLPDATGLALSAIQKRGTLRVGLVSFDDGVREEMHIRSDSPHVALTLDDAACRLRAAEAALDWAREQALDLLMFPELTLPSAQRHALADRLFLDYRRRDVPRIPLILLGSFHDLDQDATYFNRAVLVAADGTALLRADKRRGATFGQQTEDIHKAEAPQGLLPLPFGLLTISICKDFFDAWMTPVLDRLEPDWVLVPSMSDSLNPHRVRSKAMRDAFGTVSLIVNQPMPEGRGHGSSFEYGYAEFESGEGDPRPNVEVLFRCQTRPSARIIPIPRRNLKSPDTDAK